jgi:hypothetical protein
MNTHRFRPTFIVKSVVKINQAEKRRTAGASNRRKTTRAPSDSIDLAPID